RACNALNTTTAYLFYEVIGGNGTKIRARKLEQDEVPPSTRPPRPEQEEDVEELETPREAIEPSDVGKRAQELLTTVLKFIEENAEVDLQETADTIELNIRGNGSGLLIGKHGQTLEAFQHLVAKMSGLDRKEGKKLVIDAEGYRARRREALESLARKLA